MYFFFVLIRSEYQPHQRAQREWVSIQFYYRRNEKTNNDNTKSDTVFIRQRRLDGPNWNDDNMYFDNTNDPFVDIDDDYGRRIVNGTEPNRSEPNQIVSFNPIQSNPIQSNPIQSNPIQFNSIQFNSIQFNPEKLLVHTNDEVNINHWKDIELWIFTGSPKMLNEKEGTTDMSSIWNES